MASIIELIKNIRNARLGKDVRESIASAIEQTYEDASEQGNANMEVVDARGSYDTLRKRLDNSDNAKAEKIEMLYEIIARQNADSSLQTQINSLASGSPLPASSVSEMTDTTRVYVNTTDGHWYTYDGTNWVDRGVYQASAVGENAIYLSNLNNKIIGHSYRFTGSISYPQIKFNYNGPAIPLADIVKLEAKFKFKKNDNIIYTNAGTWSLRPEKNGWWGVNYPTELEIGKKPNEIIKDEIVFIKVSKNNINTQATRNMDTFGIGINTNQIKDYDFTIIDPEIYINDLKIDDKYLSLKIDNNYSDTSDTLSYLATKNYVDVSLKDLEKALSLYLKQYDSYTKSNLYSISCWGDSLTEYGENDTSYCKYLSNIIGNSTIINNLGKSGQCSGTVAFRQGGNKLKVIEEFTISNLPSTISQLKVSCSIGTPANFLNVNDNLDVTINNIQGKLNIISRDGDNTYLNCEFTRNTPGTETIVSANTIIKSNQDIHENDLLIIWVGRNDIAFSWPYQINGVIDNIKAMVNHLEPVIKRYLIINVTTTTSETIGTEWYGWVTTLNEKLKDLFPYNYVPIREYLVNQCIYDEGVTPTETDLEKMAGDTIPPSLMEVNDTTHPNALTREFIARYIYNELSKRDWIKK